MTRRSPTEKETRAKTDPQTEQEIPQRRAARGETASDSRTGKEARQIHQQTCGERSEEEGYEALLMMIDTSLARASSAFYIIFHKIF